MRFKVEYRSWEPCNDEEIRRLEKKYASVLGKTALGFQQFFRECDEECSYHIRKNDGGTYDRVIPVKAITSFQYIGSLKDYLRTKFILENDLESYAKVKVGW